MVGELPHSYRASVKLFPVNLQILLTSTGIFSWKYFMNVGIVTSTNSWCLLNYPKTKEWLNSKSRHIEKVGGVTSSNPSFVANVIMSQYDFDRTIEGDLNDYHSVVKMRIILQGFSCRPDQLFDWLTVKKVERFVLKSGRYMSVRPLAR